MRTKIEWIEDRALASRHTKQWAEKFRNGQAPAAVTILSEDELRELTDRERQSRLRSNYFYAVQAAVERLTPDADYYIPGNGASAWMYVVDPEFAKGTPAHEAAERFVRDYARRNPSKRSPETPVED